MACQTEATFFSSMGAALKLEPTHIKIAEFWKVQGDPLARVLRKKFKHEGQYPARKFLCVYSDELIEPKGEGKGSLVHITAIFGHMLAGLVVQDAGK
jgi:tRNA A37 threonylcarbamoyladenosine dehydratase